MPRIAPVLATVLLAVPLVSPADAEPIFVSQTFDVSTGTCCIPFTSEARIVLGLYLYPGDIIGSAVFDNYLFGNNDVGSTVIANALSDADFPNLVAALTNGVDDLLGIGVLTPQGYGLLEGIRESALFNGLEPVRQGPDLRGYQLSQISLMIANLSFAPFPHPEGGVVTNAQFRFAFEGETPVTPEPGTIGLVFLGLASLAGHLRHRRDSSCSVSRKGEKSSIRDGLTSRSEWR